MTDLEERIVGIIQTCAAQPAAAQAANIERKLTALLAEFALNPTGDEADRLSPISPNVLLDAPTPARKTCEAFFVRLALLRSASLPLAPAPKSRLDAAIRSQVDEGHINPTLVEKFRLPANRQFLDRALVNAGCAWQLAMVAHWALNAAGMSELARSAWHAALPDTDLDALVSTVLPLLRFDHLDSLREYRRLAMRHVPRLSDAEFRALLGAGWRDVIDLPSGRGANMDIPFVTPFVKQGDIEYSLYRHYLVPDLAETMRRTVPPTSASMDLAGRDITILYSLPIVIQQAEDEVFHHVKSTIATIIRDWAGACSGRDDTTAGALRILERIWNYRRSPAASDCNTPVENLIKGFNATTRNSFSHFSDINIAAACGDRIDPVDVAEKFILFASVSNGQLDNLAEAHRQYCHAQTNPARWDNEAFFSHFLAANRNSDLGHIQAHFLVDKTRGCPAIPQIPRFHGVVLDLVLGFVMREFGEANLRQAGGWYQREKTPGGSGPP